MTPSRAPTPNSGPDIANVDLRRLRYFVAVCDHGGFSRAAAAIGVAQPALTRQVRLLEEEVGQLLLERTGRGAHPSEAGKFLLARSRAHLDGLEEALRELRFAFADVGGPLTLGACPSIAPLFVDDLLAYFARRRPNISLSVIIAYSGDLKSLMQAGRIDIAITYSGSAPKGSASVELFSERLVLVGGSGALPGRQTISLAEVARMKLILPSRIHELRAIIDRVSRKRGVSLTPDIELDTLGAVKGLLLEQPADRRTILPERSVQAEVEAETLSAAEFDDPDMRRTVAVVTPKSCRNVKAASLVSAWIIERALEVAAIPDDSLSHPTQPSNPTQGANP